MAKIKITVWHDCDHEYPKLDTIIESFYDVVECKDKECVCRRDEETGEPIRTKMKKTFHYTEIKPE